MTEITSAALHRSITWQSDDDMQLRKLIMREILKMIRIKLRGRVLPERIEKRLPLMVRELEEVLYLSAPSLECYKDLRTMKSRIKTIAARTLLSLNKLENGSK